MTLTPVFSMVAAAEAVAFGEPRHGLGCAVVFGVVAAEPGDRVCGLFQVFNAVLCNFEPFAVAGGLGEGAVEGYGVVTRVGKVVAEYGGELDEFPFGVDHRAHELVERLVLDTVDEFDGFLPVVIAVKLVGGNQEGCCDVFFSVGCGTRVHHRKVAPMLSASWRP